MAWAKATTITSWSFSRLKVYQQCPFKAKLKFIDKLKEPSDPDGPMARGDRIHKLAQAYIEGKGRTLPAELALFPNAFKKLRAIYKKTPANITVEETWAFRKDWSRTTWDDWNNCWVRIKVDVQWIDETTVMIVDFKTGKYSPQWNLDEYMEQLELYAAGALLFYADRGPNLKVIPALYFLDHEIIHPEPGTWKIYVPSDLPALKKKWEKTTKPMLNDKTFAPKPNRFCYNCHFRKDNVANGGGQCKF